MSHGDGINANDEWQNRYVAAIDGFAVTLKELHQNNPWPDLPVLPKAMNYLMTELWDRGFSQTHIRQAFEDAVADMPRYAAGKKSDAKLALHQQRIGPSRQPVIRLRASEGRSVRISD